MQHRTTVDVQGPWSLTTSRAFWEGFTPAALAAQQGDALTTVFLSESDWRPVEAAVTQDGTAATILLTGDGDLESAVQQVRRFLSLDIDATGWPTVGQRDPSSPTPRRACRDCGRADSTHRTKQRPGLCSPSGSGSPRRRSCGAT